jgi:hypothetical protein
LTVDPDTARELVTEGIVNQKSKGMGVLAEIGEKEGCMITVKSGRFGPYINWKKVNVNLPAEFRENPSEMSLEEAWSKIEEKAAKGGGGKAVKKKYTGIEIPPGPKRPLSAYLLFSSDKRPEVAAKFSSLGEVSKELARMWKECTDEEREPYLEKASAAKVTYEVAKEKWKAETQKLIGKQAGGRRSISTGRVNGSTQNLPKRPRSAYIFFCNANRADVSKEFDTLGEISKELARRWANLDPDSKKEFDDISTEDKKRYEREKEGVVEADISAPVNGHSPKKTTTKNASPKKRQPSGYMLFCKSHRDQIVDDDGNKLSLPETTKILAQMWKECDDETRAKFLAEAGNQKEAFASS